MPIYEYEHNDGICGSEGKPNRFETLELIKSEPLTECGRCGKPVHRIISSPSYFRHDDGIFGASDKSNRFETERPTTEPNRNLNPSSLFKRGVMKFEELVSIVGFIVDSSNLRPGSFILIDEILEKLYTDPFCPAHKPKKPSRKKLMKAMERVAKQEEDLQVEKHQGLTGVQIILRKKPSYLQRF